MPVGFAAAIASLPGGRQQSDFNPVDMQRYQAREHPIEREQAADQDH